nr:leucine-rich repeat extensin-like protein 3 [Oncorhynchus nerka]
MTTSPSPFSTHYHEPVPPFNQLPRALPRHPYTRPVPFTTKQPLPGARHPRHPLPTTRSPSTCTTSHVPFHITTQPRPPSPVNTSPSPSPNYHGPSSFNTHYPKSPAPFPSTPRARPPSHYHGAVLIHPLPRAVPLQPLPRAVLASHHYQSLPPSSPLPTSPVPLHTSTKGPSSFAPATRSRPPSHYHEAVPLPHYHGPVPSTHYNEPVPLHQ